ERGSDRAAPGRRFVPSGGFARLLKAMCSKNEVLARRTRPETAEPRPNAAFPRLDETRPGVLLQSFNEQNAEEHRGVPKARFCCTWNHGNMPRRSTCRALP
ncbi:MAG: hypothetical protein ACLTM6_04800, partial [Eggerthella lenta]